MKTILVTGSAGFIGFHLSRRLLENGYKVIGYDSLTTYYDVELKLSRNKILNKYENFINHVGDIEDSEFLFEICSKYNPSFIVHLAAQAGVRYSIKNPRKYVETNVMGTFNVMELSLIHI